MACAAASSASSQTPHDEPLVARAPTLGLASASRCLRLRLTRSTPIYLGVSAQPESTSNTPPLLGLHHVAIYVAADRYTATLRFYREGMGMRTDWSPDDAAAYLTSGADNFALHRVETVDRAHPPLDHLGFMVPDRAAVEAWHLRLSEAADRLGIELLGKPRLHRDGASSFYLLDPAGNKVQIVHIPSISG
jgi:catechol 2,3-dioxygenase-like lactoylglutathione lyase family enzyme